MQKQDIGLLAYALLGLIQQRPASGYDLRKIFTDTPMGSFSNSPGAIYPALRRMEEAGLIRGKVEAPSGLRQRKIFKITASGHAALKAWLTKPVSREDVTSNLNELMLRFAFIGGVLGNRATARFLRAFEAELKAHTTTLKAFLKTHAAHMPTSGRLALESGVIGYEAQHRWALRSFAVYKNLKDKKVC